MATKAPFISKPYSAYDHREIPREDEELTHVGPGSLCGEYMRRFWQPIIFSKELTDLPVRLKILGEDLVVFRDKAGQVGCLELHCSHRGTSLEFGLIEQHGIRCCYHGWLFGVDGRILDTPGEPPDSTYKDRLCHGAYPVHEYQGLVFAYMGPPDKRPCFPLLDTFELLEQHVANGSKDIAPCNWLQVTENAVDAAHTVFLHTRSSASQFLTNDGRPIEEFGDIGELAFTETPTGMVYINTRRANNDVWVRMGELIPPNIQQTPGHPSLPYTYENGENEVCFSPRFTKWVVPLDDTHTMSIMLFHPRKDQPPGSIASDQTKSLLNPSFISDGEEKVDRNYEDRQRNPGDYEAEVSQRPIAVHAMEHLGATDRGVTLLRKMLREGIRAVQRGETPKGVWTEADGIISTYGCDTIMRIPPAPTIEEDNKLLRETGKMVLVKHIECPPIANGYAK